MAGLLSEGLSGIDSVAVSSSYTVRLKPFVKGGLVNVDAASDFDDGGVKPIAFGMEDPPSEFTLCNK